MAFYPSGGQQYRLNSSIGSTDTSLTLASFTEPISETAYTMAVMNTDVCYGTISPQSTQSEFISFTGITQNADGTATLTGVTRGLSRSYPYTTSTTFKLPHSGQSIFILSDAPGLFNEYTKRRNTETVSNVWTFTASPTLPTPVANMDAATKAYADSLSYNGTVDANTTTKGIVEQATTAEIDAGTSTGSTGAVLAVTASPMIASIYYTQLPTVNEKAAMVGTSGSPSATNLYVTALDATAVATVAKIVRWNSSATITVSVTPSATTDAVNKTYVDTNPATSTFGVATMDISSTAVVTITHNLGRTPKLVRISAMVNSSGVQAESDGVSNGSAHSCIWRGPSASNTYAGQGNGSYITIIHIDNSNVSYVADSITSTAVILTNTKDGSPTGTSYLLWEAI